MEENKEMVIAKLKEQLETKSSILQSISQIVAYQEKRIEELNNNMERLGIALKGVSDLEEELQSLRGKYDALKYHGRDIEVDALKREVNFLRDYIDECYSRMKYEDVLKLETKFCFVNTSDRYTIN